MSTNELTPHSRIIQDIYEILTTNGYRPLCAMHSGHDNPKCAKEYRNLIPLYATKADGKPTRLADVDMVVPFKEDDEKIKYIIEVEESFSPKTIVGDITVCQLSKFCRLKLKDRKKLVPIEGSILFVVVDSKKLNVKKSSKKNQFDVIRNKLKKKMMMGSLKDYFLIYSSEIKQIT
jgi:hypothetical protein